MSGEDHVFVLNRSRVEVDKKGQEWFTLKIPFPAEMLSWLDIIILLLFHYRGMRSGTLPHVLCVGLGTACEVAKHEMEVDSAYMYMGSGQFAHCFPDLASSILPLFATWQVSSKQTVWHPCK